MESPSKTFRITFDLLGIETNVELINFDGNLEISNTNFLNSLGLTPTKISFNKYNKKQDFIRFSNSNPKPNNFLPVLRVSGDCLSSNNGIQVLNIDELDATNNIDINDISFMKNSRKLRANGKCGIRNDSIINLKALYAVSNKNIFNVSFMKNLQILDATGNYGIDQNGINGLNLIELYARDNDKIKNVSFMKKMKVLDARGLCGIDQNGISDLNLRVVCSH